MDLKIHLTINAKFCFSRANVDDRDTKIMSIMTKEMSGKLFGYKGYQKLAEYLWNDSVELIYNRK